MRGEHKHRCGYEPFGFLRTVYRNTGGGCGLVFAHGDENAGNKLAHTCTHCGVDTWWRYEGPLPPGRGLLKRWKRKGLPPPITEQMELFP